MLAIAIVNLNGGSGKTTTVISLAGAFALAGKTVLVIDLDHQADLTDDLLTHGEPNDLPLEATAAALFGDQYVSAERLIVPTAFPGLSLLPCSELLRDACRLGPEQYAGRQFALRDFLSEVAHRFDVVLIDNRPDLGFLSLASLTAADYVLTPHGATPKGFRGLKPVNRFVAGVQASSNPALLQLGYVRTVFEARKNVHQTYSERIERAFPSMLLQEAFPKAATFEDADAARMPIGFFKPKCAAAKAVERIRLEIEERIGRARVPMSEVA